MKTLTYSMLLACFSFAYSAFASGDSSCAFNLNENLTLTTRLYQALPEGMWVGNTQDGRKAMLQFHTSGAADWFTFDGKGMSAYKDFTWAVRSVNDDEAKLELTAAGGSGNFVFQVETGCHNLTLTDSSEDIALTLEYESADSRARQKENILAGRWENNTYPFDLGPLEGAYLKYNFDKNGRFLRMLGCANRNIKEAGEWRLANDGQHLVMRFDSGETTVAEIKYLELDEMVLHHVLNCEDSDFATGDRDFFFNRQ